MVKITPLPSSNMFAAKIKKAHHRSAKVAAGAHPSGSWPRKDKGIVRGPLTDAQKAHRAALRSIRKHTEDEIKALGPLTADAIAEIIASLKKPHCKLCTDRCKGCKYEFSAGCSLPHTCGRPSSEQLRSEKGSILCHARRPCRVTAEQEHANQWAAWNAANKAEKDSLVPPGTGTKAVTIASVGHRLGSL